MSALAQSMFGLLVTLKIDAVLEERMTQEEFIAWMVTLPPDEQVYVKQVVAQLEQHAHEEGGE